MQCTHVWSVGICQAGVAALAQDEPVDLVFEEFVNYRASKFYDQGTSTDSTDEEGDE